MAFLMRTRMLRTLSVFFLFICVSVPQYASAAVETLVSRCTGIDCQLCHVFELIDNLVQYAILLGTTIAAIGFAIAGVMLFISQGDPTRVARAHAIFKTVFFGFVLALIGFLVVETIVRSLASEDLVSWKGVNCSQGRLMNGGLTFPYVPPTIVPSSQYMADGEGLIVSAPGSTGSTGVMQCPTCVTVDSSIPGFNRTLSCAGTTVQTNGACYIDSQVNLQLINFTRDMQQAGISWQATELWPPQAGAVHAAGCHASGTCIDAAFNGTAATAENIARFISVAERNGFRAEYEVATQAEATRIRNEAAARGITLGSRAVIVVPYIIGSPHFSMYRR